MQRRILIVGATGLVGTAATEHFAARPGWEVVTLSRRPPADWSGPHLAVDLTDHDACAAAFRRGAADHPCALRRSARGGRPRGRLAQRAAAADQPGHAAQRARRCRRARARCEHVTILQGGKAYGSHLGRVPVPAKERWPRMSHRIFYWQQEDLLRERAAAGGGRSTSCARS